jgi:hypothetical protein
MPYPGRLLMILLVLLSPVALLNGYQKFRLAIRMISKFRI